MISVRANDSSSTIMSPIAKDVVRYKNELKEVKKNRNVLKPLRPLSREGFQCVEQ